MPNKRQITQLSYSVYTHTFISESAAIRISYAIIHRQYIKVIFHLFFKKKKRSWIAEECKSVGNGNYSAIILILWYNY